MNTIIFYKSKTSFTKEYAELLERRLVDSEIHPIEKINKKILLDKNFVFFGGPLRGNVILGLKKFLKHYKEIKDKDIFVFAVGMQPVDQEKKDLVITTNNLDSYHIRLYFLQGGLDFTKFGKFKKKIIMYALKEESKKSNSGIPFEQIESRLNERISFVSSSNLDRMVDVYHKVKISKSNKNNG